MASGSEVRERPAASQARIAADSQGDDALAPTDGGGPVLIACSDEGGAPPRVALGCVPSRAPGPRRSFPDAGAHR